MKSKLLLTLGILTFFSSCSGSDENATITEAGLGSISLKNTSSNVAFDSEEIRRGKESSLAKRNEYRSNESESANNFLAGEEFKDLLSHYEHEKRKEWQRPDAVVSFLGNIENKIVMDLGAGSGYFAFRLHEAGAHIVAAEIDDRFLQYLEERRNALEISEYEFDLRKVFFDDPLLKRDELDMFFTVNTYHHLERRVDYLKKVIRGIKPGGRLVVVDFKKNMSPHGPPANVRLDCKNAVVEVQEAGFSQIHVDTNILPEQYILMAVKPL